MACDSATTYSGAGVADFQIESELLTYLRLSQPPLKSVRLKLMRKGETREVELPLEPEKN